MYNIKLEYEILAISLWIKCWHEGNPGYSIIKYNKIRAGGGTKVKYEMMMHEHVA